jgi:predicted permease
MSQAALQTLVLALLMAAGFAAGKLGYLDERASRGLSKFLVNFVIPALVVSSMQRPYTLELRDEALRALAVSVCVYALSFPLAFLWARAIRAKGGARGAHAFGAVFSNVAFMGFPVMEALYGRDSLFALSVYNIPFQILAFSVGPFILARSAGSDARLRITSFATPAAAAAALGFALFAGGVALPALILGPLELLGGVTTPLSMALIGAILSRARLGRVARDPRLYATAAYRLLAFPLLVYAALFALGFRGRDLAMPVLIAAMPVAANSAILAEAYGGDAETASSLVLISTIASLVTIPLVASLLP